MTPRSLILNPGGVYSTPQGMDLKFVEIGARLLMWMASASHEVEHSGSTMYNTPSILAQLGEYDIRLTRVAKYAFTQSNLLTLLIRKCISLLFLSNHTLADLGFSQGGMLSTNWAILDRLAPTQGRQNCDVCHAGG